MKINNKILHIPPYLSTTWHHVQSMYLKNGQLVIILDNQMVVEIPNLNVSALENVFEFHSQFLEQQAALPGQSSGQEQLPHALSHARAAAMFKSVKTPFETDSDPSLVFGFGMTDALGESFGAALHHNASQSDMPDLPTEVLSKISAIAKIISPEESQVFPKPEPHCNCTHCQIAKALQQGAGLEPVAKLAEEASAELFEEEVAEADLKFQQWNIEQMGDKLFSVANRLDANEKYSVYLGHPVGCTCGKEGCEHILAVLKS